MALRSFDTSETFATLIKLMNDPDKKVRSRAIWATIINKDAKFVPHIASAIIDIESSVSWTAVHVLTRFDGKGREAVPQLLKLLEATEDEGNIYRILKTLQTVGDQRARKIVEKFLDHPNDRISHRANLVLDSISRRHGPNY
jgi:HEAT repeat protein